jgi:hypothetical protein
LAPLTFHWKAGAAPPLPGAAVKVTGDPGQKGFGLAAMATEAGNPGVPVMTIELEEAGLPETHCREEVRMHATASPVTGLYVNVELLAPAFVPFTFHWYAASGPPLTAAAENATDVPMQKGLEEAAMETLAGS